MTTKTPRRTIVDAKRSGIVLSPSISALIGHASTVIAAQAIQLAQQGAHITRIAKKHGRAVDELTASRLELDPNAHLRRAFLHYLREYGGEGYNAADFIAFVVRFLGSEGAIKEPLGKKGEQLRLATEALVETLNDCVAPKGGLRRRHG